MPFTEFCCRAGGSNKNAGTRRGDGTVPGVNPDFTYTGSWNSSTRVFTVASGNPASDGVAIGDFCAIDTGGSVAAYIARVGAVSSTSITLLVITGSGTLPANGSYTLRVGGAWKGPDASTTFPIGFIAPDSMNSNSDPVRVNFRTDQTYQPGSTLPFSTVGPLNWQGFSSAYGDSGMAVISGTGLGSAQNLANVSAAMNYFCELHFRDNGTANADLVTVGGARCSFTRCIFAAGGGSGAVPSSPTLFLQCESYGNNRSNGSLGSGFKLLAGGNVMLQCIAHRNLGSNSSGFLGGGSNTISYFGGCIAANNGQYGFGTLSTSAQIHAMFCDAFANGSDAFFLASLGFHTVINCCCIQNGAYGIRGSAANTNARIFNNAFFGNALGRTLNTDSLNDLVLTASPYVNGNAGDFRHVTSSLLEAGWASWLQTAVGFGGTSGIANVGAVRQGAGTGINFGRLLSGGI